MNREIVFTLDDVLMEDGEIAPFSRAETTFSAMGRYGNVLLINGETDLALDALLGEVVRFYLTDTANSRVFKVALPGARMKLVGGDSGRYEHQEFVDEVIVAPSERVVVDVLFDEPGALTLEHRTPKRTYALAGISVAEERAEPSWAQEFEELRVATELAAEREGLAPYLAADPDKMLALVAEMDLGGPELEQGAVYACPMHPEIIASWVGKCPKCGMKLLPAEADVESPTAYACPMHPEITATWLQEQRDKLAGGEPVRCECCLRPIESPADATENHGTLVHAGDCEQQWGSAADDEPDEEAAA